jgi:hypothetical protein
VWPREQSDSFTCLRCVTESAASSPRPTHPNTPRAAAASRAARCTWTA